MRLILTFSFENSVELLDVVGHELLVGDATVATVRWHRTWSTFI